MSIVYEHAEVLEDVGGRGAGGGRPGVGGGDSPACDCMCSMRLL